MLLPLLAGFFPARTLHAEPRISVSGYIDSITTDEEGGKLSFPFFVYAEPVMNEIYVIDSSSRIIVYTTDLFPMFTLSKKHGIENPQSLTVDDKGNVYVVQAATKDNPRGRITVLNACLKWVRDIYFSGFEGAETFMPYRIAMDKKENLYVTGISFPGVVLLDKQGNFYGVLSPDEGERKPTILSVTIDKDGNIYLLSDEEGRIYVYDENKKFLFKFGEKGGSTGKLSRPNTVGVDISAGKLYVLDYMRHTMNVYDKTGKYLSEFGGMGWGEGWFQYPSCFAIDPAGRILVADTFNDRVQVLKKD